MAQSSRGGGQDYYSDFGQANIPAGLSNVVAIAAGDYFSLALRSDGTVVAWGDNRSGQTTLPAGLSDVVALAAGANYSLALRSNGTVAAWGSNQWGQSSSPNGWSNVVAIAAGSDHNLGLRSDGTVVEAGSTWYGSSYFPTNAYLPATVSGSVDTHTPGSYVVTYRATNFLGGTRSTTRTVVVVAPLTLTYTAGVNGSISGSTPQNVDYGTNGTAVIAVPAPGYHFVDWSDGSTASPRTDNVVMANRSVTANFAIGGYLLTYTAGANGSLTGSTPQTVNYGTAGTAVTAVPAPGYHFVSWSDGSTANPRTDTGVVADRSVTANFENGAYTLTYTAGANGSISGSTPQTVEHGTAGTAVTAVPALGHHFVSWSDNATANPRTDTNVMLDVNVTATFAINTYTLTYAAGANGSITGTTSQTLDYGTAGTAVTAIPAPGHHFLNWSDGSTANPRTDTQVTADLSVTANFATGAYTLTYTAGANGSITGSTPQTVEHGTTGTAVTAVPDPGYHFVDWSDGSTANPRTDSNVMVDRSVTANFAIGGYLLTYTAGANGSLTGSTPQTVNYGTAGTAVTAVPATGYAFENWSDGATANPRTDTNVIANVNVTANFGPNAPGNVDPLNLGIEGTAVYGTAVQPDGKTIISGIFTSVLGVPRNGIARLNADGTLDMGFDPNAGGGVANSAGVVTTIVLGLAVQADGKVLIGGTFTTLQPNGAAAATTRNRIARLNADGTLDEGFDPNANSSVSMMIVQADGKVLIGGSFTTLQPNGAASPTTRNRIARLHADGTLDLGFDPNVIRINAGVATGGYVASIVVQADGKVLLGGQFSTLQPNGAATATPRNGIARLNADGTLDPGFDPSVATSGGSVQSIVVQADGKVLLGGGFSALQPNGAATATTRNGIARLNADGTLDMGFHPNPDGSVYSLALQADGKVLIGGGFTGIYPNGYYTGTRRNRIARFSADGTLDPSFDPFGTYGNNPGNNTAVYGVAVQPDGKVLLGGTFTARSSITRNFFARFYNDAATQTLSAPGATQALWSRGGAAPEFTRMTFELSTDGGTTWGTPIAGTRLGATANWQATGLALPASGQLRARGVTSGGYRNGSSGLIEQVTSFTLYTLTYAAGANGTLTGTTPQSVVPGASGTAVTAVASIGYHFANWSDGVLTAARTDTNVTANQSVTANFLADVPVIDVVSPNTGLTTGGTSVTLIGVHFLGTSSVTFGGTAATIVSVNDSGDAYGSGSITVTSPAHAAGEVNVVVTTPGGSSTDVATFTYIAPLSALDTWRAAWYGPVATNAGNAANNADPYHTGIPNLLVFAFFGPNQDPATAQIRLLPQVSASGGFLSYHFSEPAGVSGLSYGAEWSTTLQAGDWQAVTDTGVAPGEHLFSVPMDGARKFLRLIVMPTP